MANDEKNPKQATPPTGGAQVPTGGDPTPNNPGQGQQGPTPAGQRRAPARSNVRMVKVTNKHTAPLGLPPVTPERSKQLGREHRADFLDRPLDRGENTIPADHWEAVRDQSPVRNWLEEGWIVEGGDPDARADTHGETYRESVATLREEEAQRYIDASTDPGQLAKWNETERRPAVREAIQRRMDAIGAGK